MGRPRPGGHRPQHEAPMHERRPLHSQPHSAPCLPAPAHARASPEPLSSGQAGPAVHHEVCADPRRPRAWLGSGSQCPKALSPFPLGSFGSAQSPASRPSPPSLILNSPQRAAGLSLLLAGGAPLQWAGTPFPPAPSSQPVAPCLAALGTGKGEEGSKYLSPTVQSLGRLQLHSRPPSLVCPALPGASPWGRGGDLAGRQPSASWFLVSPARRALCCHPGILRGHQAWLISCLLPAGAPCPGPPTHVTPAP